MQVFSVFFPVSFAQQSVRVTQFVARSSSFIFVAVYDYLYDYITVLLIHSVVYLWILWILVAYM